MLPSSPGLPNSLADPARVLWLLKLSKVSRVFRFRFFLLLHSCSKRMAPQNWVFFLQEWKSEVLFIKMVFYSRFHAQAETRLCTVSEDVLLRALTLHVYSCWGEDVGRESFACSQMPRPSNPCSPFYCTPFTQFL